MHLTVYSEKVLTIDSQDHTASDIFPGISQGITYNYNTVFGLTLFSCAPLLSLRKQTVWNDFSVNLEV